MTATKSGGHILVDCLRGAAVEKIFCVPGESYLDALDGLYDARDIQVVTCRQEGGAAFMAEAYAKLTGKAGVCFVTRGPGACNAAIGVHTAMQDSTPMILLVGQVARDQKGREAFQEVEYRDMFKPPFVKAVFEIDDAATIPDVMAGAFYIAHNGRAGPVVIALPEDMLRDVVPAKPYVPQPVQDIRPTDEDMAACAAILAAAEKPVAIVGGGNWDEKSIAAMQDFCARHHIPVTTGFRRQDAFDNRHACYAGSLGTTVDSELVAAVAAADVILAIGTRLGEILTQGYTVIKPAKPDQRLIHVYPDALELNKVYTAEKAVHATVAGFAAVLDDLALDVPAARKVWCDKLAARYRQWSTVTTRDKFAVDLDGIIQDIADIAAPDAIFTTDAGNFSGWPQRFLRYRRPQRLLAPTSGAMGYGVPAAIAASLAAPDKMVIGFMGDGGFMMTGQEMATAMATGARPVLLVFNNGMYGTIRMHQEKHYPGRTIATTLHNPDFAALAESYGAAAYVVTKTADFKPALQQACAGGTLALIEIRMDPEQITTGKKMSELS